jgi:hypothetical protein
VELQFTGWYYKAVDNVVFEAAVLKRDADTLKAQSENRMAVEDKSTRPGLWPSWMLLLRS